MSQCIAGTYQDMGNRASCRYICLFTLNFCMMLLHHHMAKLSISFVNLLDFTFNFCMMLLHHHMAKLSISFVNLSGNAILESISQTMDKHHASSAAQVGRHQDLASLHATHALKEIIITDQSLRRACTEVLRAIFRSSTRGLNQPMLQGNARVLKLVLLNFSEIQCTSAPILM